MNFIIADRAIVRPDPDRGPFAFANIVRHIAVLSIETLQHQPWRGTDCKRKDQQQRDKPLYNLIRSILLFLFRRANNPVMHQPGDAFPNHPTYN